MLLAACLALAAAPAAEADPPLRIVFADNLAPLSFEEDGRPSGLFVDLVREAIGKRLGKPVETLTFPWARAQQMVMHGEADGFVSVATKARLDFTACGSVPALHVPLQSIIRKDDPRRPIFEAARSLEALKSYKVISYRGNGWAKQYLAGFDVFYASDFDSSLRGLARGRGDLSVITMASRNYFLHLPEFAQNLTTLPVAVGDLHYYLCIADTSPYQPLLPVFDRAVKSLRSDGTYRKILAKYGLDTKDFH
ncbi:substrate-binding periplasmic protein [Dongia rigui]|nr:transporter substrate-binding domain-containing protein [Dongia rigui]